MKSAHKLAAALAVLISLLVTGYFILTALQNGTTAISVPTETPSSSAPTSESTSSQPVTSEPTTRSGADTTNAAPRSLAPSETTPSHQPMSEQTMTTATSDAASSSAVASESTSGLPVTSESTLTTETTEAPSSSPTTQGSTPSQALTSEQTIKTDSTEAPSSSSMASESTPSQPVTSEQTTTTTAAETTTTITTTPTLMDSEKLYKETTLMPAHGFQMAPEEERAWQEFKEQFRKSYQSAEEERGRAEKFVGNLRFINAHNRIRQVSFKLGVNQFADLGRDEINARHIGPLINWTTTLAASGATKPPQMRILEEDQATGEGSQGVDWRNSTLQPPLDQGLCPESAVFAVISSLEASLELAGLKGVRLSPKQLMDCLTYSAPPPPAWPPVCSGQLSMVTIWEFLQRQSIRLVPLVEEYEQFRVAQMQGMAPPQTCIPPLPEGVRDQRPKVASYHKVPSEHFEVALQNRGPLVVAIDASRPTFHFYKSGFYHDTQCSSDAYNMHALLVASKPATGEGPNENPAHFTLRASLGVNWGESGHIHLLKDATRNKCLPEQLATYPDLGFE